jgi:hypothetical protein
MELYNDSELQMNTQLILCIEELDIESKISPIDTRVFIGWNETDNDYFIRGKRQDLSNTKFVPFAFNCASSQDLYDFLEFTLGKSINIILYNFNNIDSMSLTDLNYEFFEDQINKNYEIAGYDKLKVKRRTIVKYLRMLKKIYN